MNNTSPHISSLNNRDYLKEYDAASNEEKYPLVKQWLDEEPLSFFKQLRKERPILVTPECTLIASFNDVRDVLLLPKIFTTELYKQKAGDKDEKLSYMLTHDDDAFHTREKSIMQGFLNRDDLPRIRQLIQASAKSSLDNANGHIELINDYCRQLPAILVEDYFGLDGVDKKDLIKWSFWKQYNMFYNHAFDLNSTARHDYIANEYNKVTIELESYIKRFLLRKIFTIKFTSIISRPWHFILRLLGKKRKDDIVNRMMRSSLAKEVNFSVLRVAINAGGLLIGSIETTSKSVACAIKFFLDRPELLAEAKAAAHDDSSEKFDGLVWEALRYVPLSPYLFRYTSQDYTIAKGEKHQTTIPKDTQVLILTQSAMFDDYAFENPDNFNGERDWSHHFAFGFGAHECLGKYIGMVMIPEMVRQVLLRDDIHAVSEMDYQDGPFPENYQVSWR